MKQTIEVLNQMVVDEIIASYAIGGAIAAFRYIEPASTDDLDILVSFDADVGPSGPSVANPNYFLLEQERLYGVPERRASY
jgi:hypothetical protein